MGQSQGQSDERSQPGYLSDFPHLRFRIDLNRPGLFSLWSNFGEAISKCKHVARVPLKPSLAKQMHTIYLAKGAQATTAIEGNTLTEEQVKAAAEKRLRLPPSQRYLQQEVDNVIEACNTIEQEGPQGGVTPALIKRMHSLVFKDLEVEDHVLVGDWRRSSVGVGGKRSPDWQDCPELMDRLCKWLDEIQASAPAGLEKHFALMRAILAHLYLVWIHPFGDGNGRTARLLEFWILKEANFPSISNHLFSNYYNLTRDRYYRSIERSKGTQFPDEFLGYAMNGFVEQLREQIGMIRGELIRVCWENYVYEVHSKERPSEALGRRRKLAVALGKKEEAVAVSEIRELSSELAELYATKTRKTITRDINDLAEKGLLEPMPGGKVRAKMETIQQFMHHDDLGD